MKILVTGYNGFIGRHLVKALAQIDDVDLVLCGRSQPDSDLSLQEGRIIFKEISDLREEPDWNDLLSGDIDAIVHLASLMPWDRTQNKPEMYGEFYSANVVATKKLAMAGLEHGISKMIFLSSIGINGSVSQENKPFNSTSTVNPVGNYALSKQNAEEELFDVFKEKDANLYCVRAPNVYGSMCKGPFRQLYNAVIGKKILPVGGIVSNKRDMISVYNLNDLIISLLKSDRHGDKRVVFPSDGQSVSTASLVNTIAESLDVEARTISIPAILFKVASKIPVIGSKVEKVTGNLEVEDEWLRNEHAWVPKYSIMNSVKMMHEEELEISVL